MQLLVPFRSCAVVSWIAMLALGASACTSANPAPSTPAGAPADASVDAPQPTLGVITVTELSDALKNKNFLLINVHTPAMGEITGTDVHIVYSDIDALAAFIGPDLAKATVLYCKTSSMSTTAGTALAKRGYTNLRYLEGGMTAWTAQGFVLQ